MFFRNSNFCKPLQNLYKRALYIRTRALHICESTLYIRGSALYIREDLYTSTRETQCWYPGSCQSQAGSRFNVSGAESSTAANNEAACLIQDASARAARIVAEAKSQAQGVMAKALQEREGTRLERSQAVQEREHVLAEARFAQCCFLITSKYGR